MKVVLKVCEEVVEHDIDVETARKDENDGSKLDKNSKTANNAVTINEHSNVIIANAVATVYATVLNEHSDRNIVTADEVSTVTRIFRGKDHISRNISQY